MSNMKCIICGKTFYARPYTIKKGWGKYCSKECQYKGMSFSDPFCYEIQTRWTTMMSRCYNPNRKKYKNYGARGIKVCEDWHNIRNFANWCKKSGYKKELQLDRINNDGNYCPENCHWVSAKENSQNKRNTRFITALGKTLCVSEWARELNISPYTIYHWANQGADYAKLKLENRFLTDVKERL